MKHCRFSYTYDAKTSIKGDASVDHAVSIAEHVVGRQAKGAKVGDFAWVIHTPEPGIRVISIGRIDQINEGTDTWLSKGGPRHYSEYEVSWIVKQAVLRTKWLPLGDQKFDQTADGNGYTKMLPLVLAAGKY